jgi:hypothetical protein
VAPTRRDSLIARIGQQKVLALGGPHARLGEPQIVGLFEEAVREYSRVRRLGVVATLTGDGATFAFPLPNGTLYSAAPAWEAGVSAALSVEFPAGARVPIFLDDKAWSLVPALTPTALQLIEDTPATGQTFRLGYTVSHVFSDVAVTVPPVDDEILVNMTARLVCLTLAAATAENRDPLIAGDAVNYKTISATWADRARDFGKLLPTEFQLALDGQAPSDVGPAASAWVDWDLRASGNYPFVWHPGRIR